MSEILGEVSEDPSDSYDFTTYREAYYRATEQVKAEGERADYWVPYGNVPAKLAAEAAYYEAAEAGWNVSGRVMVTPRPADITRAFTDGMSYQERADFYARIDQVTAEGAEKLANIVSPDEAFQELFGCQPD